MGAGESSVGPGALRQRGAEWVESRLLDAGVDRPARVVLIGDSELINEGLRVMLSHHGDQVEMIGVLPASAPLPPEGVAADVALVNIHSRDDRFQHLVESLVAADPPVRVVIFADDDDERRVFEALRLGVSGYLLESSAAAALADHLVRAGEGELVIDPRIATRIATRVARGDSPSWPGAEAGLSRREGEVLQLLLGGRSNRQIAEQMVLGNETVKTHLRSIYRKMGVANRAQAVATAIRQGMWTGGSFMHAVLGTGAEPASTADGDGAIVEAPTRG
jgi:DNA-binding NarL/FixJ family response regulator